MEIGLWITQYSLLAIFIGVVEILGALGVVLTMLTGVLPWLTPLAAIGLTLIQISAIFTEHLPKKEYKMLPLNLYFMAMSIFVLIGRWSLFR